MSLDNGVQFAGDVLIESLKLVSAKNLSVDLDDFLIELNIYEDIFSNFLRGDIVLSDSRNLIEKLPIIGEEYLIVKLRTPTLFSTIEKTFRVVQLTDRKVVRDNNTQVFILNFVSQELIADILLPLYNSFEGNIDDVVIKIYTDYIMLDAPLKVLIETKNRVKFVSPGWTPFKCINWLASKSIPKVGKACSFLFFESNKAFYFTNMEAIFDFANKNNSFIGTYSISSLNVDRHTNNANLNREYFITESVDMIATIDYIKNYTNGYLANRLVTLDVFNKIYELVDYDHVTEYKNYIHTSGENAVPLFAENTMRNPASNIGFYPINPKLFNNFENNVSEKIKTIYGNRKSNLLELTNVVLNINVPGRTDVEVGGMLKFLYPELGPRENSTETLLDKLYSGYYLITAIRHKITRSKSTEHRMIMEIIKDSIEDDIGK